MNSQRLEEIVAELMKPFRGQSSFDTDLSALLEEYLTKAGIRALDADEDADVEDVMPPNFVELALLLHQSANLYGHKVDFLYEEVRRIVGLYHRQLAYTRMSNEPPIPSTSRRKRNVSRGGDFTSVELDISGSIQRKVMALRQPPTLPRIDYDLQPLVIYPNQLSIQGYTGEIIGVPTEFHLSGNLNTGLLTNELRLGMDRPSTALRPISLVELQAAIYAAAPLSLPPPLLPALPPPLLPALPPPLLPALPPTQLEQSLPPAIDAPDASDASNVALQLLSGKRKRKRKTRRSDRDIDDIIDVTMMVNISADMRLKLSEVQEFSIPRRWISRVVAMRKSHILSERRRLRAEELDTPGSFAGWSHTEAAAATAAVQHSLQLAETITVAAPNQNPSSDDNEFFEQSYEEHTEASQVDEGAGGAGSADRTAWKARVELFSAAAEARGSLNVQQLGARVLASLAAHQDEPRLFTDVLREQARDQPDVSRLLLATLFLANAGNVELVQGPPLSVNSFSVRMLSSDD